MSSKRRFSSELISTIGVISALSKQLVVDFVSQQQIFMVRSGVSVLAFSIIGEAPVWPGLTACSYVRNLICLVSLF